MRPMEAVVMGASAGGLKALTSLLSYLPPDYNLPVIIVQHMSESSDSFLAEYLNKHVAIEVKEAIDKETIRSHHVYLAPPGYHLLIEDEHSLSLSIDPKVNYSRPSIDVLFDSAAYVFQEGCVGIVLTGANRDGSAGLRAIKESGGIAIVQDPESAEFPVMPEAAIDTVKVDYILSLEDIGKFLRQLDDLDRIRHSKY